jgi:membrane protein
MPLRRPSRVGARRPIDGPCFARGMRDQLQRIGKRFIGDVQRDDAAGLAAELAYRFLFAVFPFGIFVAALTAFVANAVGFADPTSQIMGAVGDNLPAQIANGVRPQLEAVIGTSRPGLLTFGAIAALWAATGGTNSLIKAMNRAWEVEETRPLLPRYGTAIGLTLLASVGLIGSFVTIVGASLLTTQVVTTLRLDQAVVGAVNLLRWPLVFVLLSVAVGILYHWAPNFRAPWRWCLVGGAIFSVAWILATGLFALYVANFANYANTYGALGGVIVLMLWFYLSALILVAAAALVAATLKELHPTVVRQGRVERGVASGGVTTEPGPGGERTRREGGRARPTPGLRPAAAAVGAMPPRAVAPQPSAMAAPSAATPSSTDEAVAPRPARRRFARRSYRMSGPEDWAFAGVVTAIGASIGAALSWLLGTQRTQRR